MSATSKSFINNTYNCICVGNRSLIQGGGDIPISDTTTPVDYSALTDDAIVALHKVQDLYGLPMVNKQYEYVSSDYQQYVDLYVILTNLYQSIQNPNLALLIQIAKSTLIGAVNSTSIYGDNLALQLSKVALQNQINDILSNKNQKLIEVASSGGQLSITKSFKLAPIFNYYILIYGLPAYGVGFDPLKISFLVTTLNKLGINPYK